MKLSGFKYKVAISSEKKIWLFIIYFQWVGKVTTKY